MKKAPLRRSREEVQKLVGEIDVLRSGGMTIDAASKKVGLAHSVYARHKKMHGNGDATRRGRPPNGSSIPRLLARLRAERDAAIVKVTALGTAIDALEDIA